MLLIRALRVPSGSTDRTCGDEGFRQDCPHAWLAAAGRGGVAGASGRTAADYFPAATAAAVHPLAAEPAGAGGGRASRRPQTARGTARARAGLAPVAYGTGTASAGVAEASSRVRVSEGTALEGSGGSGAALAPGTAEGLGPAQGAGAAGSPSPNPVRPRPPLSAEQRRARALVSSVLPFDAVTFRGRGRHAGRAGLEVLEACASCLLQELRLEAQVCLDPTQP